MLLYIIVFILLVLFFHSHRSQVACVEKDRGVVLCSNSFFLPLHIIVHSSEYVNVSSSFRSQQGQSRAGVDIYLWPGTPIEPCWLIQWVEVGGMWM